jgi:hypothetical protein
VVVLIKRVNINFFFKGLNNFDFTYFKSFTTQNERVIKKLYGNPFSSVTTKNYVRRIIKDDNKIKIELSQYGKNRDVNNIYFKRNYDIKKIIFDLKSGNITTYHTFTKGAKIDKKTRINCLNTVLHNFEIMIKNTYLLDFKNSPLFNKAELIFDNGLLINVLTTALNINIKDNKNDLFYDYILPKFISDRKIKVPNNYSNLIVNCYPTEKYLKKNKRKLVLSLLDKFEIKTNKTNSILNLYPSKNILYFLKYIVKLFGSEYLQYINFSIFDNIYKSKNVYSRFTYIDRMFQDANIIGFKLTHKEKLRLINIINTKCESSMLLSLIIDHIKMIKDLKNMGIIYIIRANDFVSFMSEHDDMSQQISRIKKGYYEKIIYDDNVDVLENTIKINNNIYKPILLRTDSEYQEEGKFQHHCVETYFKNSHSIIISVRCNDERVTCEFDSETGRSTQIKYVCNEEPPAHFGPALLELEKRVIKLAKKDLFIKKNIIKIPISEIKNDKPEIFINENNMEFIF